MRELICPKCGSRYELHPLDSTAQELCPACRNKTPWEDIRTELANASQKRAMVLGGHEVRATLQEPPRAGI